MPVIPRRRLRPIAAIGAIALLTLLPLDPGRIFGPPPAGVLGEVDVAADQGAAMRAAPTTSAVQARIAEQRVQAQEAVDGDALLRFSKELHPTVRIAPVPETLRGYRWPLTQIRITQPFGPARGASWIVDGQPFHDGLDVATFCGDRVYATHDGLVLAAGRNYDEFVGWLGDLTPYIDRLESQHLWTTLPITVVIDDGNGYRSLYAHFSKVAVKAGDTVKAGAFLGYEGATGNASGCHVHYGLFSPDELRTMTFDPKLAAKMLLPAAEIARVDPLRVLPPAPKPSPSAGLDLSPAQAR